MNKANGSIVIERRRLRLLLEQNHVGVIQEIEIAGVHGPERIEGLKNVMLDDALGPLVEPAREPIRAGRFVVR